MSSLFADTSFFIAFLNPDDFDHVAAYGYMANHEGQIVTTDWVLTETSDHHFEQAGFTILLGGSSTLP